MSLEDDLLKRQDAILDGMQKKYDDLYVNDIKSLEYSAVARTLYNIGGYSLTDAVKENVKKSKMEKFDDIIKNADIYGYNGKEKMAAELLRNKVFSKNLMDNIQNSYYKKDDIISPNVHSMSNSVLADTWNSELQRYRVWNAEKKEYENGVYMPNSDEYREKNLKNYDAIELKLYDACRFRLNGSRADCIKAINSAEKEFDNFKLKTIAMKNEIPIEKDFLAAFEKEEKNF